MSEQPTHRELTAEKPPEAALDTLLANYSHEKAEASEDGEPNAPTSPRFMNIYRAFPTKQLCDEALASLQARTDAMEAAQQGESEGLDKADITARLENLRGEEGQFQKALDGAGAAPAVKTLLESQLASTRQQIAALEAQLNPSEAPQSNIQQLQADIEAVIAYFERKAEQIRKIFSQYKSTQQRRQELNALDQVADALFSAEPDVTDVQIKALAERDKAHGTVRSAMKNILKSHKILNTPIDDGQTFYQRVQSFLGDEFQDEITDLLKQAGLLPSVTEKEMARLYVPNEVSPQDANHQIAAYYASPWYRTLRTQLFTDQRLSRLEEHDGIMKLFYENELARLATASEEEREAWREWFEGVQSPVASYDILNSRAISGKGLVPYRSQQATTRFVTGKNPAQYARPQALHTRLELAAYLDLMGNNNAVDNNIQMTNIRVAIEYIALMELIYEGTELINQDRASTIREPGELLRQCVKDKKAAQAKVREVVLELFPLLSRKCASVGDIRLLLEFLNKVIPGYFGFEPVNGLMITSPDRTEHEAAVQAFATEQFKLAQQEKEATKKAS